MSGMVSFIVAPFLPPLSLFQTMGNMNKVMDPMKTAKTMQDFERQSAKMEMTEEMSKFRISQKYHQLENHVDSFYFVLEKTKWLNMLDV